MPEQPPLEWDGFASPRYTQIPDDFFDVLMVHLSEAELRVVLYIMRRTFGWKKDSDTISIGQMVDGIVTRDGRRLDNGCGASKASVVRALKTLKERGIVVAQRNTSTEHGHEATTYTLRMKADPLIHGEPRVIQKEPRATITVDQGLDPERATQQTASQDNRIQDGIVPLVPLVPGSDEPGASTLTDAATQAPPPYSPWIGAVITDFSRELDGAHANVGGHTNAALALWQQSGLSEQEFVQRLQAGKAAARRATPGQRMQRLLAALGRVV